MRDGRKGEDYSRRLWELVEEKAVKMLKIKKLMLDRKENKESAGKT